MIKKAYILFLDACALIRFSVHLIILKSHPNRAFLHKEAAQWVQVIRNRPYSSWKDLLWLLRFLPEYRSVLYLRLGGISGPLSIIAPPQVALYIAHPSSSIGCGLVIQHGHSTRIGPHKIGENCQIWHNVTIGASKSHTQGSRPILGNNIKVSTGAIVLGGITIGDNAVIAAGSVVVKDVQENTVVAGNPAKIIKRL